ncbi:MAG: hypothetical protein E6Q97_28845 [Desulfurellales bacterium]|nr:MAG: hypothetical protein E6Q97_28845 [Desulfurellales bacterium]
MFKPHLARGEIYNPLNPSTPTWAKEFALQGAPRRRSPAVAHYVRSLEQIDAEIAERSADRQRILDNLRAECKHVASARVYMAPMRTDEYGTTTESAGFLFCTDCGQSFNKREGQ